MKSPNTAPKGLLSINVPLEVKEDFFQLRDSLGITGPKLMALLIESYKKSQP